MCNRLVRAKLKTKELKQIEKLEAKHGIEVLEARKTPKGIVPTLINGIIVDRADWPDVVWINRSCTATLVGPNCAITAAHCGNNNENGTLELYDGTKIDFTMMHMPQWQDASDYDLAVLRLHRDADINNAYASIGLDHEFFVGQPVSIAGFGCTQPGGTGGNDGHLRKGPSRIVSASGQTDVMSRWIEGNGGALCFGDSGGPMFEAEESSGNRTLIAVNSKGNIRDTNYNMRLDIPEVRSFLETASEDYGLKIKGLNFNEGGGGGNGQISAQDVAELETEFAQVKSEMEDVQKVINRLTQRLSRFG